MSPCTCDIVFVICTYWLSGRAGGENVWIEVMTHFDALSSRCTYPASSGFLVALCSLLIRPPEHRATKKPLLVHHSLELNVSLTVFYHTTTWHHCMSIFWRKISTRCMWILNGWVRECTRSEINRSGAGRLFPDLLAPLAHGIVAHGIVSTRSFVPPSPFLNQALYSIGSILTLGCL